MESNSFDDQCNVLKYIMQPNSLSDFLKFIGDYTPKLCKLKMNYYDKTAKLYTPHGLVHGGQ